MVKAEPSQVGAAEMRLVVKVEQVVVRMLRAGAALMALVEVRHGVLAVGGAMVQP